MAVPVLQAMLLADQIYQDRATGKYVICGIFSAITFVPKCSTPEPERPAPAGTSHRPTGRTASSDNSRIEEPLSTPVSIPPLARVGSPFAFVSLTELQGSRKFEMRYVDLQQNNILFSTAFEVSCRNPLETIQITVGLPPLPTPHEGVYVLELLCEGEMLGSHRVLARLHAS